ncbi:hypothetical protein AB0H83_35305 [Dactylosporangium sp. NPDC050688]|uniref:hypothetical protein n=1 Tax=Dactylosporangium sp. NPDC050688 TaxID=3157217 RepID=UPI0034004C83
MMNALAAFLGSLESLHPRDAYARVERQLADARNQLVRHGRESGIPLVIRRGALVAVAVAAEYAGQRMDIPGLGLGVTTLGVVSGLAVNVASKSIQQQSGIEHDYRYLHLAESEFKDSGFPV